VVEVMTAQETRDRAGDLGGTEHPDLYRGNFHVIGELFQNQAHNPPLDWFHVANATAGLDGQRGYAAKPITAMRGDGLDIGRNARAGRRIVTGNGENYRFTLVRLGHLSC